MADDFQTHLVSRRTFLFSLAAVTCFGLAPKEARAASSFTPFAFGYVTDVHMVHGKPDSYLQLQESQLFLQDVVKQLNQEKLDFVIFGGDQVETPGKDETNWQLFVDVAQGLTMPWSFVLGEKDVSGSPPVDKMKLYGPDWKNKGIKADNPYWSQTILPGVHIIGLDTSRSESTTGDVSDEQIAWLKQDLADSKGKFTIIFSHHPILAPAPFDTGPPWDDYITAQGEALREVLGASRDVRLAVSGHLHVNKVQQEQKIWYVSSASLDVYPCVYKIFRVTPESIQIETYQVSFPALVKKAKTQLDGSALAFKYNSQKPAAFADIVFGGRVDNAAILPLVAGELARPIDDKKLKQLKEEKLKNEQKEAASGKDDKKGGKKKGKEQPTEDQSDKGKSSKDESGKDKSGKDKPGKDKAGKEKSSKDKSNKGKSDSDKSSVDNSDNDSSKDKSSKDESNTGDKGPDSGTDAEPKSGQDGSSATEKNEKPGKSKSGKSGKSKSKSKSDAKEKSEDKSDLKDNSETDKTSGVEDKTEKPSNSTKKSSDSTDNSSAEKGSKKSEDSDSSGSGASKESGTSTDSGMSGSSDSSKSSEQETKSNSEKPTDKE